MESGKWKWKVLVVSWSSVLGWGEVEGDVVSCRERVKINFPVCCLLRMIPKGKPIVERSQCRWADPPSETPIIYITMQQVIYSTELCE